MPLTISISNIDDVSAAIISELQLPSSDCFVQLYVERDDYGTWQAQSIFIIRKGAREGIALNAIATTHSHTALTGYWELCPKMTGRHFIEEFRKHHGLLALHTLEPMLTIAKEVLFPS